MIIDEKALCRRMKEAYKGGGYSVAATERNVMITDGTFFAEVYARNMPRKALGLIAEHVGAIPGAGEAYFCKKGVCQTEIFETSKAVGAMRELEQLLAPMGGQNQARPTRLTLNGLNVWQNTTSMEILLMAPELEETAKYNPAFPVDVVGNAMYFKGDVSRLLIVKTMVNTDSKIQVEHLEGMQWV